LTPNLRILLLLISTFSKVAAVDVGGILYRGTIPFHDGKA